MSGAAAKVVEIGLAVLAELVRSKAPDSTLEDDAAKVMRVLRKHQRGEMTEAAALEKLERYRARRAENNADADAAVDKRFPK